ncbi:cytochrome P450 [Rhodococcus artemisiae]|uniref:Cytochrome P450 n=1 Tax=Rhodococcus artemisiae TaxID=714159 RepID=A0ABU7L334_9NOCA|nr:cytochrome P450 [Rhodococcus artemisiae]MEE2055959.1 cytochrome P450 [Rhodococcus artemisiae]
MTRSVDDVIAARREGTTPRQDDLLQRMLEHPDPDTGELLSDRSIRNQVLTFLIAGHETTAGTLSFAREGRHDSGGAARAAPRPSAVG